jgi:hypothetical protein
LVQPPDVGGLEEPYRIDAPRRGRKKKATAGSDDRLEAAAMIGALSIAVSAAFIPPSLVYGEHWRLEDGEAFALAESLQKALQTLPGNSYADIKKYIEKFVPWVALTITAAQIVGRKWEITQYLKRERDAEDFSRATTAENFGPANPSGERRPEATGIHTPNGDSDTFKPFPTAD